MAGAAGRDSQTGPFAGEPGIGTDLKPPFTAEDEATRRLFSLNRFGIRPGLVRIESLLNELGHPEREVPTIVVAGTNGKGSTTHVLAELLRAAGYRTASYTSPHLLRVYERLYIDGRPVDPKRFAATAERLRPFIEKHGTSWFESLTGIALEICREEGVEWLCCETGLGGRLDASNALPAEATLLTTIAMDHAHILGETIPEIAAEKLGLLKRGAPLFCGVEESLRAQVFEAAVAAGSGAHFLDELCEWTTEPGPWCLTTRRAVHDGLPDTGSRELRRNVALALLCLEEMKERGRLRLPDDIPAALARVFLPGRCQVVLTEPDWIFDTAHNEQAVTAALRSFLDRPVAGRRFVIFGSMRNKEPGAEAGRLLSRVDRLVAAPVRLPRSRNREELGVLLKGWELGTDDGCEVVDDLGAAIATVADETIAGDAVLVVGSCFTVAEVLYRLGYRDLEQTRRPVAANERLGALRRAREE